VCFRPEFDRARFVTYEGCHDILHAGPNVMEFGVGEEFGTFHGYTVGTERGGFLLLLRLPFCRWRNGFLARWVFGSTGFWLDGFLARWVGAWLDGCLARWVFGSMGFWPDVLHTISV
jgi:hypothetical protein